MTRLRPAASGPGSRALLGATALGAVLVTGLALAFAAFAAGPPARAHATTPHVATAAAVPAADAWRSTVEAFGARAGQLLDRAATDGARYTSTLTISAAGTVGTAGSGDARHLQPRPRRR
jgi:hypothetical protein